MGAAYIQRGELERGLQCCDEALTLAPIPRDAAWARVVRGYGEIKAGHFDTGIATLTEALSWFANSQMRYTYLVGAMWLAEGHLRRSDHAAALPLVRDALKTCRENGYRHFEGRACWLMSECLAIEAPDPADNYARTAISIFEGVGAKNDLARAMVTRARLRRDVGDVAAARELLTKANTIFQSLGTRDELVRIKEAFAQLPVL
jgi:tetratricopeptide (TPR) repeat protein